MNKQEAIKKTEELERQLAELKAIIEAPDTSELVFEPIYQQKFWFIQNTGFTQIDSYHSNPSHQKASKGNCFRTEEDAKNSAKYYMMNSEYDYWFPWTGQPKPKVLPKGLEYWSSEYHCFKESKQVSLDDIGSNPIYRWKRSEQG